MIHQQAFRMDKKQVSAMLLNSLVIQTGIFMIRTAVFLLNFRCVAPLYFQNNMKQ